MKRYIQVALFACVSFLMTLSLPSVAQKIDSMINVYGEKYPQEKIYLHFDKAVYSPGETIWFKAYLFAGIGPSAVSKNFYAELTDPATGRILQRKMMPIFEATTTGFFELPATFATGSVVFRAYTTWMLNFDTAFVYNKPIRIINKTTQADKVPVENPTTLKFFPESGDLVNGLSSQVAFKAVDRYGYPVTVRGVVKDDKGKVITDFATVHDGMGKYVLVPQDGSSYYAEWQDEKKKIYKTPLPAALPVGAVLETMQSATTQAFGVKRSENAPDNLKTLYLLAYFNQQVVYKARLNLTTNFMTSGGIPLAGFPTGILQMTLFDANWKPLAERIAFINKDDYSFSTRVVPVTKNLDKRGKNVLTIEVPDTVRTNLSLSITDAGATKADPDADNIISHLLLSGDLKGYVHNPYYYFVGTDDTLRSHLDLVMMTNGWRRFKWEDLAAGKLPDIKYPRENYLSLNAQITGLPASQVPVTAQLNVFLESKDSSRQFFPITGTRGKFKEEGLVFFDTVKVFYQFNKDKTLASRAAVIFDNGTWKGYPVIKPDTAWRIPMPLDTSLLNRAKFLAAEAERIRPELDRKVKVLETVTVKARTKTREQQLEDKYTSGLFKGGDGYSFNLLDDPLAAASMDIFQYLQGRVAGLQITRNGSTPQLTWRQSTPTLFLDEMQVDASSIQSIPVTDIAYVKVMRPPFFGAPGGGSGGAIAIYTRRGGDERAGANNNNATSGLDKGLLVGYSAPKEFYSPDYSKKNDLNEVPDVRSTLYWAPYILTGGQNRRITVEFYNNDISKKLRIILEGMDDDGRLTRVEKIIE